MKNTQSKKPSTKDNGNVRIGGMSPVFDEKAAPKRKIESTKDSGRVRIGAMSPSF